MHIKIEDNFDGEFEEEYKRLDDETAIGNGKLSNSDIPIVEVKSSDIKKVEENENNINEQEVLKVCNDTKSKQELVKAYSDIKIEDTVTEDIKQKSIKEDIKKIPKVNKVRDLDGSIKKENTCDGTITVCSRLGGINGTLISDAKINLYILNGLTPKLISSKITNKYGRVIFENLASGSYRVIAIVNKKYFEKPTYIPWNEVTISEEMNENTVIVINKIKK